MRPDPVDYEKEWAEFWEPIISEAHVEGSESAHLSEAELDQIKRELSDYSHAMREWSRFLDEITWGRMSKPNYTAEAMISVVQELDEENRSVQHKELEKILDWCVDSPFHDADVFQEIANIADNALIGVYTEESA